MMAGWAMHPILPGGCPRDGGRRVVLQRGWVQRDDGCDGWGRERGRRSCGCSTSNRRGQSWCRHCFLWLRVVDVLSRDPLLQHNEGITDLFIGAPNRDVALFTRAFG